jgi:hypothetical protein
VRAEGFFGGGNSTRPISEDERKIMDIQDQLAYWFASISLLDRLELYKIYVEQSKIDVVARKLLMEAGLSNKDFLAP